MAARYMPGQLNLTCFDLAGMTADRQARMRPGRGRKDRVAVIPREQVLRAADQAPESLRDPDRILRPLAAASGGTASASPHPLPSS